MCRDHSCPKAVVDKAAEESDCWRLSSRTQMPNLASQDGTNQVQFITVRTLPRAPHTDAWGLAGRFHCRVALAISQGTERDPRKPLTCRSILPWSHCLVPLFWSRMAQTVPVWGQASVPCLLVVDMCCHCHFCPCGVFMDAMCYSLLLTQQGARTVVPMWNNPISGPSAACSCYCMEGEHVDNCTIKTFWFFFLRKHFEGNQWTVIHDHDSIWFHSSCSF